MDAVFQNPLKKARAGLFSLVAGISLLLFLLTAAFLIRSFCIEDGLSYTSRKLAGASSFSIRGEIYLEAFWPGRDFVGGWKPGLSASHGRPSSRPYQVLLYGETGDFWQRCGFAYSHFVTRGGTGLDQLFFPQWILLMMTAGLPACWLRDRFRRQGRRKLGLCLRCGYDVRATPNHCSECGFSRNPI